MVWNTVSKFNAVYKLVKETGKLKGREIPHANQSGSVEIKDTTHAQRLEIEPAKAE